MSRAHMRELSQKFEGVGAVDPPSLSRRVRRIFPDLTSPLTKRRSRQLYHKSAGSSICAYLGNLEHSRKSHENARSQR